MPEAAGAVPQLIRIVDGTPRLVDDGWRILNSAAEWEAAPAHDAVPVVLPLELACAHPERVRGAGRIGIWLTPADDPARTVEFFPSIGLIAVDFPTFTDGRGYSTAVLLRTRHGWRGELRAIGDVLRDQLFALRRVGYDSFALRASRDAAAALQAFATFSGVYQGSTDQRRARSLRASPSP